MRSNLFITIVCFLFSCSVIAQIDTLETVRIKVNPVIDIENIDESVPFSIDSKSFTNSRQRFQQLSFNEYLEGVPGLFVLSTNNYSQDLRISIRGFGARSAFGIRGIKLVVDGIPETTPDGQGQLDNLTLSIIEDLQVLRGPASLLYGNASGGVININTIRKVDSTFIQAGTTIGNYNMNKFDILGGIKHKNGSTIISGSRTTTDGYRDQSAFETNQLNVRSNFNLDNSSSLNLQLNYTDSPIALDAGGLTIEEVNDNRRQARSANLTFDGREQVRQLKTGISYKKLWKQIGLESYAFYSYRDFDNNLPFENGGQVELYRNYYGHGSYLTYEMNESNYSNKIQLGYALAFQADQRQRFDNLNGERGESNFNQLESFNSYGFYLVDNLEISNWNIQGGLRYDINSLEADDRTTAANSSQQNLNSWSGSLGLSYNLGNSTYIFSNVSTSFETPALTELSSNPNGGTGFNTDLDPQRAVNYEIGYRQNKARFNWNAALFYIRTSDDLVPFELAQFPNRTFFRNAGSTNRYGLELSGNVLVSNSFTLNGSYTYSRFEYDEYTLNDENFQGNLLPGIPEHLATLGITYQAENKLTVQWNNTYRGELFADDANATNVKSAFISNINLGYPIKFDKLQLSVNGGINNLFDTSYFDNVRINAFGNRYYEPAPGINFYTGINLRF
ncbi:iron complex outermembrane recepter protein [Nonlabens sp. Hel1_33_55]|uniref:TonB-dependent receptor family protein n=1 Tax=Nonlabens sp. Hel1_33_55 TaxID=1336802 RepID=UPI000875EF3D|nr:TonB-dependent receptor [Nonlabens sp. Hel1_33_55]SCY42426.1 iron complex outermembrane recepter protein [Nonlabens sp. Hel1_33_55]